MGSCCSKRSNDTIIDLSNHTDSNASESNKDIKFDDIYRHYYKKNIYTISDSSDESDGSIGTPVSPLQI
jgi:hypothetical protein